VQGGVAVAVERVVGVGESFALVLVTRDRLNGSQFGV
jgi:hypothetical protein